MIQLPVSEAVAFDFYAIAFIKYERGFGFDEVERIRESISTQISIPFFDIIGSVEFRNLWRSNSTVFDLVEKARLDHCKASDVDKANHQRFLAKKALQEKFWPNNDLMEKKTERNY